MLLPYLLNHFWYLIPACRSFTFSAEQLGPHAQMYEAIVFGMVGGLCTDTVLDLTLSLVQHRP